VKDLPQEALEDDCRFLRFAFGKVTEMINYSCCGRFPEVIEVIEDNRTKKIFGFDKGMEGYIRYLRYDRLADTSLTQLAKQL